MSTDRCLTPIRWHLFFQRIFGDGKKMVRTWYDDWVFCASVIASSGSYPGTFIELGQAVLQMMASVYHVELRPADIDELRTQILSMRIFPMCRMVCTC